MSSMRILTDEEVEAFMRYANDLHNGKVEKPETITRIEKELEVAIEQIVLFRIKLRQTDYGLVMEAYKLMLGKDAA